MNLLKQLVRGLIDFFSQFINKRATSPIPQEVPTVDVVIPAPNQLPTPVKEAMNTDFLNNIHKQFLDAGQYIKEEHKKTQIYLHHTAGNASGRNTIANWNTDDRGRIATCVTISNTGASNSPDGEICQAFSSKHWAYHLGLKQEHFDRFDVPYISLDKLSIGIELCAWGPLTLKGGKFYNYVNRVVSNDEVCELDQPFKGHLYYHRYSDAQIESVKNLLLYWNETYGIPLEYNEDIWDLTERAFSNESGVFTHNSVRRDKSDVFPQPELIEMLKSLA
jgi:hypothetical protein